MIKKYPLSSRVIHWLMALVIFLAIGIGIYMTEFLPEDAPNHLEVYSLHKSIGVLALLLIAIRIINRFIFKAPALPNTMKKHEIILSHLGHFGLYFLMVLVPFSGYLMSNSFGFPVHFFSIEMPFLVERNFELAKIFAETHEISAYSLIALIFVHVAAVLKHRFFDKPENDVLKRMI